MNQELTVVKNPLAKAMGSMSISDPLSKISNPKSNVILQII
jgi:hypothetical protein